MPVLAERRAIGVSGFEEITLCLSHSPELGSSCACPSFSQGGTSAAGSAGCWKGFPSSPVAFGCLFVPSASLCTGRMNREFNFKKVWLVSFKGFNFESCFASGNE